ncbi:hypothetical protein PR048_023461 [Dryococelus australis]|uniref:Uncharacterized protein n=1 Tax=Dryococelus australis TaxID=614101 RepID=A0ABQ9GU60_9NEOP|nr:hypothetical protein PR048_023461 [Dryococelus australis]
MKYLKLFQLDNHFLLAITRKPTVDSLKVTYPNEYIVYKIIKKGEHTSLVHWKGFSKVHNSRLGAILSHRASSFCPGQDSGQFKIQLVPMLALAVLQFLIPPQTFEMNRHDLVLLPPNLSLVASAPPPQSCIDFPSEELASSRSSRHIAVRADLRSGAGMCDPTASSTPAHVYCPGRDTPRRAGQREASLAVKSGTFRGRGVLGVMRDTVAISLFGVITIYLAVLVKKTEGYPSLPQGINFQRHVDYYRCAGSPLQYPPPSTFIDIVYNILTRMSATAISLSEIEGICRYWRTRIREMRKAPGVRTTSWQPVFHHFGSQCITILDHDVDSQGPCLRTQNTISNSASSNYWTLGRQTNALDHSAIKTFTGTRLDDFTSSRRQQIHGPSMRAHHLCSSCAFLHAHAQSGSDLLQTCRSWSS